MTRLLVPAAVVLLATIPTLARQAPDPAGAVPPAFEVASVKPNTSVDRPAGGVQFLPGGRLSAVNMPLSDLIHFAYQVRPFQIDGIPDWAAMARYDINAKAATELPANSSGVPPAGMQMLQRLLADRFMLRTHTEMREMPTYTLALARPDGKLGPMLTVSTTDCTGGPLTSGTRGGLLARGPDARMRCGLAIGPQRISAGAIEVAELASALLGLVQRPVVDRTGLTGRYDVQLTFQGESLIGPGGFLIQPPPDALNSGQPSLFTALQEQLGLKLVATRAPAPVLVVDHLERPTGD